MTRSEEAMSAIESRDSPTAHRRHIARGALLRLVRWYVVVIIVFGVVWWLSTVMPQSAVAPDTSSPLTGEGALLEPSAMIPRLVQAGAYWIAALIQMLAALLLVVPLAGTYVLTRARPKYDPTLVQTVIVLPVAITAVLMMVSHSLALAFGLAGVVGAVRFRSTLGEAGDAVYIFAAIVIGFAAGIHAVGIAAILSILFVALELGLWYWDVASPGARYWQQVTSSQTGNSGTFDLRVTEEPARQQILRVNATDLTAAEPLAADALAKYTKRYQLVGRSRADDKTGTLEHAVRLRKQVGWQEVTRRLNDIGGGTIRSVQWRAVNDAPPVKPNGKPGEPVR